MKKILFNKKNLISIITILILFLISFIVTQKPINTEGDDIVYRDAFNNISTFVIWSKGFVTTWGGRILALSLATIFLNLNINIFIIANALAIVALVYGIYKIIEILNNKESKYKNIILFSIMTVFLLINKYVIKYSVVWVTGTFNYLWPTTAMVIAMIPFIKKSKGQAIKKVEYLLYIPSTILAANIEQTGVVLFVFITIMVIMAKIDKIKIGKALLIDYILTFIVLIVSLKTPGNSVRYSAEVLRWYQDFEMLSLFDKIVQGGSVLLNHIMNESSIILLVISSVLLYIAIKDKEKNKMIISCIPFIYSLIRVIIPFNVLFSRICSDDIGGKINELYTFKTYGPDMICNPENYISIIIGTFILIIIAVLIFLSFKDNKKSIIYTLLYLAGICATLSLSISPTIFASSYRIYFVTDVLNVFVASGLISEIISRKENKKYLGKRRIIYEK